MSTGETESDSEGGFNEGQVDKIDKTWRVVVKIAKHMGVDISSDEDSGDLKDSEKKPKKQRSRRSKSFLQSARSSCPPNDRSAFEYVIVNFHVFANVIRRCGWPDKTIS